MTKVSCFSNSRRGPPPPAPPSTPAAAPAAAQAGQSHSQEQKLLRRVDEELKQSARKDLWNLVFYIRKNSAVFFLLLLLAPLKELILFSRENECVVICEQEKTTGVFATCKIYLVLGLFDERPRLKSP